MLWCAHAQGEGLTAAVTFRWDYEAPGAAGFVLYCGTSTQWYTTRDDVGNTDSATLALQEGAVYFCAVTACDADGFEGRFSNEVAVRVTDVATGAVSVEPPITIPPAADAVTLTATGYRVRFSRAFNVQSLDLQGMAGGKEPPGIALVGMSKIGRAHV